MTATDIAIPVLGGPRVLVAEGDPDSSVALTAMLRLKGFDAREARTGSAALAAVAKTRPHVLILDLDLPDVTGCELIRRVRRLSDPPAVVVVTGHTTDGARKAARAAGASAYLLKPADPNELTEVVQKLSGE
ncbi:MAG TPA: response regulator [Gemmataceae bacterium]|nr:response regulator [Gemmataceae bacterium]